jgi:hypothetical protein
MTIINSNQINFKSFKPKRDVLHLIIFTFILIVSAFFLKNFEKNKLTSNKSTYAIISEKSKIYMGDYIVYYNYSIKKKSYTYHNSLNVEQFNILKKGDTILINYSTEDNSVAQIVKYYWNEELREKYVKSK